MTEALRDPVWQFVGVVISLAALFVAIAAIRFQLIRKSIAYYHSFDDPAFFVLNKELRGRFKITFDGREIDALSTIDVTIFNDGNSPIFSVDFVQPITIAFPDASHVFGVLVTETSPPNLKVDLNREGTTFSVSPLLLNPGDEFTLQFLVELPSDKTYLLAPEISSRIGGVKSFPRKPHRRGAKRRLGYYAFRSSVFLVPLVLGLIAGIFGNMLWNLLSIAFTYLTQ